MIRTQTVLNMASRNKWLFRVRRRAYDDPSTGVLDCDGDVDRPSTWMRSEEEFFTNFEYANKSCEPESDRWARRGYLDQVKAGRVLTMMKAAGMELERFERGRHRVVLPFVVEGERIVAL